MDTGVDYNNPDLDGNVWTNPAEVAGNGVDDDNDGYIDNVHGYDFVNNDGDPMDDHYHGTAVAGLAAAEASNGVGGEGVSQTPGSSPSRFSTPPTEARASLLRRAWSTPARRIPPHWKVINMSIAGPDCTVQSAEANAIKADGNILVAGAANSNTTDPTNAYPGTDSDTALRVMATNEADCRAYYSNFSPSSNSSLYNIAAPGEKMFTTSPNNQMRFFNGTPVTAGAAALVWGKTPSLTRNQVVNKLVSTGESTSCGFAVPMPRLDVRKALLGTSETALVGELLDPATGFSSSPETTPVTAKLYSGTTILKSDATNLFGFYEMTKLSAGTGRLLKDTRSGYVAPCSGSPSA